MARLRAESGAASALAWARRPAGGAYLAAADYAGEPPRDPTDAELELLERVDGVVGLCGPGADPELEGLAERHRCCAAAPVRGPRGLLLAVLLLGGEEAPEKGALAALTAAAGALAGPLAAALGSAPGDPEQRQLERLASLGSLAAEIAHEVRNPLVSVKTFVQLLPRRRDDPDFMDRFLEVVGSELSRMERLLDLVIGQGRPPDAAAPRVARVAEQLAAVGELLRHRAAAGGVRIETSVDPRLPHAALPADELRQVLLNLGLNAVDATPSGGAVRMSAVRVHGGLCVAVCDEGPGMAAEHRAALRSGAPARRAGRPGGLGLAITRRIVEGAGGSLEARNRPDGGAELRVCLPAVGPS